MSEQQQYLNDLLLNLSERELRDMAVSVMVRWPVDLVRSKRHDMDSHWPDVMAKMLAVNGVKP